MGNKEINTSSLDEWISSGPIPPNKTIALYCGECEVEWDVECFFELGTWYPVSHEAYYCPCCGKEYVDDES